METVCSILPTILASSKTRATGFVNTLYNSPWEKSIGLILIVLTRYDPQPAIRDISCIPTEIGKQSTIPEGYPRKAETLEGRRTPSRQSLSGPGDERSGIDEEPQ